MTASDTPRNLILENVIHTKYFTTVCQRWGLLQHNVGKTSHSSASISQKEGKQWKRGWALYITAPDLWLLTLSKAQVFVILLAIRSFQMSWTGNGNQNTFHWHFFSDLEFVNPNYTQFVNYTCYVLFSGKFQPGCSVLLSHMYVSNMLHTELQAYK